MKTLCEELIELFAELRTSWRPRRLARYRPPPDPPPELPPEDLHLEALAREFPRELFAQLLLELPQYRRLMAQSFAAGNFRRLRDSVHQILGAAAYCQEDELEQGLRQLRLALKTDNHHTIEHYYQHAIQAIDRVLHNSGFRRPEV